MLLNRVTTTATIMQVNFDDKTVTFDQEDFDVGGYFNVSNGRLTVTHAGYYFVYLFHKELMVIRQTICNVRLKRMERTIWI